MPRIINIVRLLLLLWLVLPQWVLAEDSTQSLVREALQSQQDASIQMQINQFMAQNKIAGAALLVYDRGVPSSYYFGYANREQKIPVTQNTIFEIGSITKIFTSLLVAKEVNAGRMRLDDTITAYLNDFSPEFKQKLTGVTLESLETHTSGLPFDVPPKINTKEKLQRFFRRWRLTSFVGEKWCYSNINMGLLGYALEAITRQNYDTLYRNRILQPLGMQPIATTIPAAYKAWVARGYDAAGKPRPRPVDMKLFPAAGAMKASGADMLLFLKAALRLPGTPVDIDHAMLLTQTPHASMGNMEQGLGWVIYPLKFNSEEILTTPPRFSKHVLSAQLLDKADQQFDADALIDKTGTTGGFRAYIALIPKRQSGIVLLVNRRVNNQVLLTVGRRILFNL